MFYLVFTKIKNSDWWIKWDVMKATTFAFLKSLRATLISAFLSPCLLSWWHMGEFQYLTLGLSCPTIMGLLLKFRKQVIWSMSIQTVLQGTEEENRRAGSWIHCCCEMDLSLSIPIWIPGAHIVTHGAWTFCFGSDSLSKTSWKTWVYFFPYYTVTLGNGCRFF